ncbi:hypothetical protein [Polaribacter glomeratus]|uniref:Uncharacterized protein n=1 Tax=Polaribacter glomeratus TaxID=102 RepID=A0A2S7WJF5_9FLAO|nr:hypothetical protein [Polaribacter glomeratus]PQJ77441.1 hypothetical protein BTO16_16590 [Polaribacter glomeratus]TXD66029.1 hypothetical protein ESX12_07685 [Polaribacter glomeratus]
MRKIIPVLIILISISCTTTADQIVIEEIPIVPKNVEIIITSDTPEFDEIWITYKDFDLDPLLQDRYGARQFNYDSNGNQEPIIISFTDYKYEEIIGNAYRNNDLPYNLKAQIFINGKLEFDVESVGSTGVYATISFNYTIEN